MSYFKYILFTTFFFVLFLLEAYSPLFKDRSKRLLHAGRNFSITALNNLVVYFLFSSLFAAVFLFSQQHQWGLSYYIPLPQAIRVVIILILFDAWMYIWHRLNHIVSILWRFHRMHHTDTEMDVSSALRFHPVEIILSSTVRLGIFLLLGIRASDLLIYETIMVPVIFLHHSNYYLPQRIDKILRTIIVTPRMHWVHHSEIKDETNSNYGTILSCWDRLAKSFRLRKNPAAINYGLNEFRDPNFQTILGMLKTPFVSTKSSRPE